MEAICPFATWHPLGRQTEPRIGTPEVVCEHTAVSPSLESLLSYFDNDGYSGVGSHFGIGRDGRIWQFQRIDHQADANLQGNDRVVSIENADGYGEVWGPGDPVPDFTGPQLESNIRVVNWVCEEANIPKRLVKDTCEGTRGVGWHRMGVEGYMSDRSCELWSSYAWKTCPGDAKIRSIKHELMPAVQGRSGGSDNDGFPPGLLLQRGDSGYYVRKLQHALALLGYGSTVDGIYGPGTENRVKDYQRDENITVDGIAGPTTLHHLEEDLDMPSSAEIAHANVIDNPLREPASHGGKPGEDQVSLEWMLRELLIRTDAIHEVVNTDSVPNLVNRQHGDGKNEFEHLIWSLARVRLDSYEGKKESAEDQVAPNAPVRRKLRSIEDAIAGIEPNVEMNEQ